VTGHPMAVPPRGEPSENFGLAQLGKLAQAGGHAGPTLSLPQHAAIRKAKRDLSSASQARASFKPCRDAAACLHCTGPRRC